MSDNSKDNESTKTESEKQHFLTNDNFIKIKQVQNEISESTGISPSFRTLANMAITNEALESIKTKLTSQFKRINSESI